jgi:GTPase
MFDIREKPQKVERALLIGVYFDRREEAETVTLLDELGALVETLGIEVKAKEVVYVREGSQKFLTGSGKAEELIGLARLFECDCIVMDNELTPSQQRSWETLGDICVIDRQEVILDIFNERARTKEARLQVELARLRYSLPRLARMWAHLDRQGGGSGGGKGGGGAARGEGEKQIEVDRRLARRRIDRLREELAAVGKQRATRRKEREKNEVPHAALVGYTNAGKSSVLNALTGAGVLVEDKLFATLDTTTRRIELPDGQPLLLTDTVGFVRKLPHLLVDAFRATLEEALQADVLVHVMDASSPDVYAHYETTMRVLGELGAGDRPMVLVLNKIDLVDGEVLATLRPHLEHPVCISAVTGEGLEELCSRINSQVGDRVVRRRLLLPAGRGDLLALLHREAKVFSMEYEGDEVLVKALVPRRLAHLYESYETPARPGVGQRDVVGAGD